MMNNEEKILGILEKLAGDVAELKVGQAKQGAQLDKHEGLLDELGTKLDHLTERVDEIDTRSLRSAVILETDVAKKIQTVFEGQELLRQKIEELAPKPRVEVLEDEIVVLKTTVKTIMNRLDALEKAQ